MSVVVMVSGGVDSFLAAALFPDSPRAYVDYGQRYDPLERRAVRDFYPGAAEVSISGMPPLGDDYHIPARNLMLATVGLRFADEVCFAGMRDEQCPDKSPDAFEDMSRILSLHSKKKIRVFSPFWKLTKAEAVHEYLSSGGDQNKLARTVSCYEGTDGPCGSCEACFRRFVCLRANGVDVPRPSDSIIRSYGMKLLHSFAKKRTLTTLAAVHSEETPVVRANLRDYPNVADLKKVRVPDSGFLIVHTELPDDMRPSVKAMLSAEGVRYDSLLTGTGDAFFSRPWRG
jgi:7-cyano-7-deazaguanine synthase in queuosine biosynthesis